MSVVGQEMSFMSDKVFIDTNILVYTVDGRFPEKTLNRLRVDCQFAISSSVGYFYPSFARVL